LKALKFKSPYDTLPRKFDSNPELFKDNPYHKLRVQLNYLINSHILKHCPKMRSLADSSRGLPLYESYTRMNLYAKKTP